MPSLDELRISLADRYVIERELGQGGMATVYLAHDVRHDRRVALKVLKPELAAVLGAERFVVEIKTTAALQHPHILPLFDSGTAGGYLFYVMPYIEGETLRARLDRETQLGIEEAIRITGEVADALDYAHRHGVIHRDIKPENILLHDGRPMVADFGIALAVSAAAGGRMTETGLSLGTPHYMSPEQATAEKELTGRSDIYSLGSVLFEMLTGNPPHTGASAQQIIMKIVTETAAPVTSLRPRVPANIAAAVGQALEKLPADRFATAAEFAAALRDPGFAAAGTSMLPAARAAGGGGQVLTRALAAVAGLAVIAAAWGWLRPPPDGPVNRYGLSLPTASNPRMAVAPLEAPDGSFLLYLGRSQDDGPSQVWIKYRDQLEGTPIAGTEGAVSFTLSPDGTRLAFVAGDQLKTLSPSGGGAVVLVPEFVSGPGGLAWLDDGTIAFVTRGRAVLSRVPSTGGAVTVLRDYGLPLRMPAALPGGRGLLFTLCGQGCSREDLWALDLATDTAHVVVTGAETGVYSPTGHLVYLNSADGLLTAVPFDLDRLETTGLPVALAEAPARLSFHPFTLSRGGTLMVLGGSVGQIPSFEMVWVDRQGNETPTDPEWIVRMALAAGNHGWSLSPDGRRLAIGLTGDQGDDIWIKQLPRGPLTRLTFSFTSEFRPRWAPDGRSITFPALSSDPGLYLRRADGTGTDSVLYPGRIDEGVVWPDGSWVVVRPGSAADGPGGRDLKGVRAGTDSLVPVLVTGFDEEAVQPSPDGRWMAYVSDETGKSEVYVRPFPETDSGKWQISTGGGLAPLWSRNGRELYYIDASGDARMMAVEVSGSDPPVFGRPEELFPLTEGLLEGVEYRYYTPWDVSSDGRFMLAKSRRAEGESKLVVIVVENFFRELRAKPGR